MNQILREWYIVFLNYKPPGTTFDKYLEVVEPRIVGSTLSLMQRVKLKFFNLNSTKLNLEIS